VKALLPSISSLSSSAPRQQACGLSSTAMRVKNMQQVFSEVSQARCVHTVNSSKLWLTIKIANSVIYAPWTRYATDTESTQHAKSLQQDFVLYTLSSETALQRTASDSQILVCSTAHIPLLLALHCAHCNGSASRACFVDCSDIFVPTQ
jgi:hypothetical protein